MATNWVQEAVGTAFPPLERGELLVGAARGRLEAGDVAAATGVALSASGFG